ATVGMAQAELPQEYSVCASFRANPEAAITACSRIIQGGSAMGRNLVITYFNRGNAYRLLKDQSKAIADYDEVLRQQPAFAPAYNNRALAYMDKGDFDRAIANASSAIDTDPNYAPAYGTRGTGYVKKCLAERGKQDLDEAIRLNSRLAPAYNVRGLAFMQ